MYVPSDSFGGMSPERRAAQSLATFFTFVAAKVVMSQLEGIGRSDLGSYNADASNTLRRFLQNEPMKDSADWLARLTTENEMLGIRIMEVRAAYAKEDFEWDNLKRLAIDGLAADNTRLLRQHANHRFTAMLDRAGGDEH
ncbi:hypothetical protein CHLNCDRAFT_50106 [Chlorella variabilis]|uniref:Uncharacterized protein n=1 Tax=Chlorella variabilis TaxID=554065 RepID=E1Z3U1_CHLVA|nr:hypothetical protein CHLNCDRAFT_50106 [Chlorella variabilis]EFN59541.1 hypothetical protein CHLNCDRAFT_50106 [Chlorella variabilis]|eukprot:XP_005851643.1 hypothetical protein CHLNCDRAFT_50106 [Chlorella variabilis]